MAEPEWDPASVPIFRFRVGRFVHEVGSYATFSTLSVRDLLAEDRDAPSFVRSIVATLRDGVVYDDSDRSSGLTVLYVPVQPGHEVEYDGASAVAPAFAQMVRSADHD